MRAAPVVLTAFPLALVGVLAAERFALLSLGADPGSAAAWEFWLNLHLAFGRVWQALEPILGGSVSSHLLGLLLVAAIVVLAANSRRWPSYSFLCNHIALIATVASSMLGMQARVSSIAGEFASPGHWAVTWAAQFSSAQLLMLFGGLASCLLCHVAVLRHLGNRSAPVSLRIRMLQQNL
jgi:hypothetical protein